ncbi:MAG: HEAT repeat domain-containing protein [Acidobacteriota bacterium]
MKKNVLVGLITLTVFLLTTHPTIFAQNGANKKLENAIAALRNIDQGKLSEAQKEKKSQEIDNAWQVIKASGKAGLTRLKRELQLIKSNNRKDDFFKLNAAALLWQIGKFDEVSTILDIWKTTPLKTQYTYVFLTAFDAALTQDERALPLLEICLSDKDGELTIALHSLTLRSPLTHQFLWETFGAKGLLALNRILETSDDTVKLQAAIYLLERARYEKSLPRIRELAKSDDPRVRGTAIKALGVFGHPQDYNFLISGLDSEHPMDQYSFVYALYEYEDLQAASSLYKLLSEETNEFPKREAVIALLHLPSVQSLDVLQKYCASVKTPHEAQICGSTLGFYLERQGMKWRGWDAYAKMTGKEKEALVEELRSRSDYNDESIKAIAKPSHDAFVKAANEWKKNHRLECKNEDCDIETLLSAATPDDMDLLLEVRASLYARLSDECLYEVETVDRTLRRLGRSRYRKIAGLTDKVEARE